MIDSHQLTKPRTIVLVDNCSAHILDSETTDSFNRIKLVFLPKNVTSVYQPCDQQLFYSLKCKYRSLLAARKAESIPDAYHDAICSVQDIDNILPELKQQMTNMISAVLREKLGNKQMMIMLKQAWNDISSASVRNCWRRSQLMSPRQLELLDQLDVQERSHPEDAVQTADLPTTRPNNYVLGFARLLNFDPNTLNDVETIISNEIQDLVVGANIIAQTALTGASVEETMDLFNTTEAVIETFEDDQPMIVLTRDIVNSAKHVIAYLRSTMEDDVLNAKLDRQIHNWEHELVRTGRQSDISEALRPSRPYSIQ